MADNEKYKIISLTFFKDWHELAKKYNLTKEQYGAVVYAMCEYCFYDKDTELAPPQGIIYEMAKSSINASNKRKLLGHQGGSQGKGGAPAGNKNAGKKKV
ncbi:hypothetical protein R84B8_00613 [Treponema sp. R8-4-B8]